MNTLILEQANMHKGSLILINRMHPVFEEPAEDMLIPADHRHPDILLERRAAAMYAALIHSLDGGERIVPVSGYRTKKEQETIYTESMRENGEEFTRKYVAYPNHSEHQTGLAIDVGEQKEEIDFIRPDFPYTGICQEFRLKAARYGFIERYPQGKEAITGIAHEPWHFRYVGYPHAELIRKHQFTLEEYTEFVKSFPYGGEHLLFEADGQTAEIFYVHALSSPTVRIDIPSGARCEVSGNNVDGFVATVWRKNG
ncbi:MULTISPECIES: M15 family metallopeptidase [Brevibacillus]|jgi:D-alanyl-D-alanine carboxypeptidase|uniref:M15 family metallopeptidase n=1 Tax=Brevibacillus TaxID=55080 RepID=UPI0004F394E1|nr:M15 family metallopeptidase [Brevibacillus borstelensis]KKX55376.1 peptidase M15 [Brevibacillus borstelensis cifa_chp40]MBE5397663.1 M15 family metallopeptidase [Brevibacillus borstelensis]